MAQVRREIKRRAGALIKFQFPSAVTSARELVCRFRRINRPRDVGRLIEETSGNSSLNGAARRLVARRLSETSVVRPRFFFFVENVRYRVASVPDEIIFHFYSNNFNSLLYVTR